jgi:hypothetical protein
MRTIGSLLLAGTLLLGAGAAYAKDTDQKVESGAKSTAKTVTHGTTAVGKGGSKIYHNLAGGVHKFIAKNSKGQETKARHMEKARTHFQHEDRKAAQSSRELKKAEKNADKVGK